MQLRKKSLKKKLRPAGIRPLAPATLGLGPTGSWSMLPDGLLTQTKGLFTWRWGTPGR